MTVGRLLLLLLLLGALPARAVQPSEVLPDAQLEARARAISRELRCLVCQNETIDESNAPLARDLRVLLRERLVAGDSDGAAVEFIVRRYGEFVLLRPRFGPHTVLLWLAPVLLVAGGTAAVLLALRRRPSPRTAPLSPGESEKLAAILGPPARDAALPLRNGTDRAP